MYQPWIRVELPGRGRVFPAGSRTHSGQGNLANALYVTRVYLLTSAKISRRIVVYYRAIKSLEAGNSVMNNITNNFIVITSESIFISVVSLNCSFNKINL